ncbi:hypothetical protein RHGRI_034739 [Rhododendron griersonianum]|uniref:Nop domain-containing protein n=1 Tax=Rhododendron griersonianum TaxID=479676 RepID=A0AAV6I2Q0_9ERIC|nr:hypothetical protein RHGRI_034739 [Rhododendron griersonianum]
MVKEDRRRRSSLKSAMMMQPLQSSLCCGNDGWADRFCYDMENINHDDLHCVSNLQITQRFLDIMQKVEDALEKKEADLSNSSGIVLEDYRLVVDCTELSIHIENESFIIHNFIRDNYWLKFPELQSIVHHPIDYARVVKKIGNEMDLTMVNLDGLLPSASIVAVSIAASTTSGKPLAEQVLQKTIEACDRALALDLSKKKVLDFLEMRRGHIAPNLSAIVGSAVTAKLVVTAGGLSGLADMPACPIRLLGAKKTNATSKFRLGYIEQTDIFKSTPPSLRMRACMLLAAKSRLVARFDSNRIDPTGNHGRAIRHGILKKIAKWQEPPPAKCLKPLPPVPNCKPKKKEGGRRLRKIPITKMANGMQFGVIEG